MNISAFFRNLIDALLDGTFERMRIINSMNIAFKEYYLSQEFNRLCKVSISQGDPDFKHEMSVYWFRSGFKISIENDLDIQQSEIFEISKYILENITFVRQLMAIGFDTLIIQGRTTKIGKKFSLKSYANLNNYFIED